MLSDGSSGFKPDVKGKQGPSSVKLGTWGTTYTFEWMMFTKG